MLSVSQMRRIWLSTQPTDMRRSYDGLPVMANHRLGEDPTSDAWFASVNRRRTQIKVLAFDEVGYCIRSKARLGRFDESKRLLCQTEFLALIEGMLSTSRKKVRACLTIQLPDFSMTAWNERLPFNNISRISITTPARYLLQYLIQVSRAKLAGKYAKFALQSLANYIYRPPTF